MNVAKKIAYKPVGLIAGAAAGLIAGFVFRQTWRAIAGDDDTPTATDEQRGWTEVLIAAALQGAIFAIVKAAVERGGAEGMKKLTGEWPD
jgi:hypothetical protein